ncbi:MAG: twin-arginine translocation pathway signal protein [Syntrophobacterales bacterium]|nr:MAG: twin-arginine translocation pathway signal protein [Syntrophobacterales bacterium]
MFSVVALVVFFAFSMVGTDVSFAADKPIKWRCQTHWPPSSASFKPSAVWMANEIEKRTNGRLIIELYNEGQLVPSKEIFTAVKRGMIDMGVSPPQYYSSQVPLGQIAAGLPFNFRSEWEGAYFYKWMGFEDMMRESLAKHGIYYATDRVYATQIVTKRPLRTLEDFKGIKVRTTGTLAKYLTAIGGAAVYIPGGETYSALASGVVDGASWGDMMGAESMGFFELCKNLLWTGVNVAGTETWLINQKALDKLPKDIQAILVALFEEHFWKRTNEHTRDLAHFLPIYQKKYGFEAIELSDVEFSKLQDAALPIWEEVAKESPECAKAVEMVVKFNKDLGRLKNYQSK